MKITIIGCGTMGKALAEHLSIGHELSFYDHHLDKAEKLAQAGLGKSHSDVTNALCGCEVLILAVKPHSLKEIAQSIGCDIKDGLLVFSLLAGTKLSTLKEFFPKACLFRLMPNLAIRCKEGIVGIAAEHPIQEKEKELFVKMFESLGKIYWLHEAKINALTSLASSGPAFMFAIVEAMVDAGIVMGFSAFDSQILVQQMIKGSLKLLESEGHPGNLKWEVASPAGTTIFGLKKLEEQGLRGGIVNTFLAAYDRARQLEEIT